MTIALGLDLTIFWRQIYNNHKRGDYKIEGEMVEDTEGYYKWENIVYMLVDNLKGLLKFVFILSIFLARIVSNNFEYVWEKKHN